MALKVVNNFFRKWVRDTERMSRSGRERTGLMELSHWSEPEPGRDPGNRRRIRRARQEANDSNDRRFS